ncbi:unnamed protein product, partial [Rotaria sordida]
KSLLDNDESEEDDDALIEIVGIESII